MFQMMFFCVSLLPIVCTCGSSQIIKMLTTVVFMFAVCWFPYHMYFILIYFVDGLTLEGNLQHIFIAIYFMGTLVNLLSFLFLSCVAFHVRPLEHVSFETSCNVWPRVGLKRPIRDLLKFV